MQYSTVRVREPGGIEMNALTHELPYFPQSLSSFLFVRVLTTWLICHCSPLKMKLLRLLRTDVPSHLHYIMLELIKNSMRATVDFHGLDEMDNNPIRVVIADGEENEVRRSQTSRFISRSNRTVTTRGWWYCLSECRGVQNKHAYSSSMRSLEQTFSQQECVAQFFF